MVIGDAIREVHVHESASKGIKDLGLDASAVANALAATWRTRVTSGSKVKSLRDVPGTDYRMRLGKYRAVFSVRGDAAFLHMVEPRDRVYERDAFDAGLRRFYASAPDAGPPSNPREMGYAAIAIGGGGRAYSPADPEWHASIGYLLRPSQQFFFNKVLPLEGSLSQVNPRLVIGHGPPGSGKTVVGIELALESTMDGRRVVPIVSR
jgi:mRNA-degrading endonuclease RelE of RelBE toxin-antitoxin system